MKRFISRYWKHILITLGILWLILLIVILATCRNWDMLAAISTWVLAAGVVFAVWQIIVTRENTNRQLEASRKSTNAQIAVELFRELRHDNFKRILRNSIYENHRDTIRDFADDEEAHIEEIAKIEHVLDWYDLLASLVIAGIVDEKLAIEGFAGAAALKCWYQLGPFIRKLGCKRGAYSENYEDFAYRSYKHFDNNKMWLAFHNRHEKVQNLIAKFKEEKFEYPPRSLGEIKKDRKNRLKREV